MASISTSGAVASVSRAMHNPTQACMVPPSTGPKFNSGFPVSRKLGNDLTLSSSGNGGRVQSMLMQSRGVNISPTTAHSTPFQLFYKTSEPHKQKRTKNNLYKSIVDDAILSCAQSRNLDRKRFVSRQMQEVHPSFSSYASFDFAESKSQDLGVSNAINIHTKESESKEEDGFEFETHEALTISADEIFLDGKIRSIPPLVYAHSEAKSTRNMLRKFLEEERISEAQEALDPGTFCEWKPNPEKGRKKSSSTNTSRRWKLRDLIRRSTSDGGDHMMAGKEALPVKSAHEIHYTKNRAMKEADKRRSFLPYRKDIVGLFGNVNGFSKALKPV